MIRKPIVPVVALIAGLMACGTDEVPAPVSEQPQTPDIVTSPVPATAPTQGLSCIKGGSTREEVRAAMGEPDSIAFGDWLYGRSSVTFGYGVVLDYSNAGGNLVLCP